MVRGCKPADSVGAALHPTVSHCVDRSTSPPCAQQEMYLVTPWVPPSWCVSIFTICFFLGARCNHLVVPLLTAPGPGNRPPLSNSGCGHHTRSVFSYIYYFMSRLHNDPHHRRRLVPFSLWVGPGIGALWGTAITNTNLGNLMHERGKK